MLPAGVLWLIVDFTSPSHSLKTVGRVFMELDENPIGIMAGHHPGVIDSEFLVGNGDAMRLEVLFSLLHALNLQGEVPDHAGGIEFADLDDFNEGVFTCAHVHANKFVLQVSEFKLPLETEVTVKGFRRVQVRGLDTYMRQSDQHPQNGPLPGRGFIGLPLQFHRVQGLVFLRSTSPGPRQHEGSHPVRCHSVP